MSSSVSATDRLNSALTGRYRIERELGAGGMATVYLAEDLKHDRKVAIKVLKPELAAVLGAERFVVEIKTTAAMSHPHILPLFDSGTADGFLFYVMPFIEGETIRDRLNRETQLGVDEAVRIAREVADALDYAHRHGVIHRDIKPENILLHDGRAMVMDFGIALAVSAAAGGRMTETGLSLGTPHYMSPEQATAEKEITARSDVYSLASVLYEMLTGNTPFMGAAAQQIIMKIITEPAEPVTKYRKSVAPNVVAAVAKSLEKLPADRFESAKAFGDALANAHYMNTGGARAGAAAATRDSLGTRALPWAIAALAAAVAITMVIRAPEPVAPREIRFTISAPDILPGSGLNAVAISPDGRDIVFVGSSRGQTRLYRRSIGGTDITPIPGTIGAEHPTISADGWLGFASPDGRVSKVSLAGGNPIQVGTTQAGPIGASWSPRLGLVMGMLAFSRPTGLSRFSATGDTTLHVITDPGAGGMHHDPWVLEGGEQALFVDIQRGQPRGLAIASLSDGAWHRLPLAGAPPDRILGIANGMLMYATEDRTVMRVGWDARRREPIGDPVVVSELPPGVSAVALAADGTLAAVVSNRSFGAVLVDDRGTEEAILPAESLARFRPRFSPDGRRAAIAANIQGRDELWLYDFGSRAVTQLGFGFVPRTLDWTPDGRRVVAGDGAAEGGGGRGGRGGRGAVGGNDSVDSGGAGAPPRAPRAGRGGSVWSRMADASDSASPLLQFPRRRVAGIALARVGNVAAITENVAGVGAVPLHDILIGRIGGDTTLVPFAATPADEFAPRFSPDGKWIAYVSNESTNYEVYVRPYPGPGPRVQVSQDGGGQPVWAPDGRRLFYRADRAMMSADLTYTGSELSVARRTRMFEGDFLGSVESTVATYDVSPDGRRFLMARAAGGGGGSVVVWLNWMRGLSATK